MFIFYTKKLQSTENQQLINVKIMGKEDVINEFMHAENLTTTELASILQRRTGVVSSMKTRGLSKNYATNLLCNDRNIP